jgi:predicted outer membrane protein
MSASPNLRIGVVAAGVSCLVLSFAIAQQEQTPGQSRSRENASSAIGQTDRSSTQQIERPTSRPGERAYGEAERRTTGYRGTRTAAGGANQAVDRFLASCLLAKNQAEVELSELAQQKAENSEVKQFAQMMIQDHRKMIEKLQPLTGMQAGTNRGVSGSFGTQPGTERTNDTTVLPGSPGAGQTIPPSERTAAVPPAGPATDTTTGVATTDRMAAGGAVNQLIQIDKQINDRCLQMAKNELQQKSGAEFDKCFVGGAIFAHSKALAALEVIGQQTQGPLAQIAQEAQPNVKEHLDHAKQLMKQLEGQTGARGTQAERQSTRTER